MAINTEDFEKFEQIKSDIKNLLVQNDKLISVLSTYMESVKYLEDYKVNISITLSKDSHTFTLEKLHHKAISRFICELIETNLNYISNNTSIGRTIVRDSFPDRNLYISDTEYKLHNLKYPKE